MMLSIHSNHALPPLFSFLLAVVCATRLSIGSVHESLIPQFFNYSLTGRRLSAQRANFRLLKLD